MSIPSFSKLVLFGNSDTDGGEGANGVYELTKKAWPAEPHYKGRFCNGPVWPEYLARKLHVTYDPQDNFAVGGAKTDTTNVLRDDVFENSGILAQVQKYVHIYSQVEAQTLFVLWGGGANFLAQDIAFDETVEQAIKDLQGCVDILTKAGAQTILMGTQPSMGSSPEMRANKREAHFHQLTTQFNDRLSHWVEQLHQQLATRIVLADIAGLAAAAMAQPQQFGFSNSTDSCLVDGIVCQDSDKYLFWDGVHFTTAFHRLLAERFYEALAVGYT